MERACPFITQGENRIGEPGAIQKTTLLTDFQNQNGQTTFGLRMATAAARI